MLVWNTMRDHAANLRRLMARSGLTLQEVVVRTGLHENTIKAILADTHKPQARTLNRLAAGLGVHVDELFQDPSLLIHRAFERQANPLVEEVMASHHELFAGWAEADFDELYSRFGVGGALTLEGAVDAVQAMNRKRAVHQKVDLLLESTESELLASLVELLYQRVVVK
jgi:transcriptional regulator with XRE-family HTH domain